MIVYPAIDLRGGRVVRLQQGDPARMTHYSDNPAETARRWLAAGAGWLHVVNLDGAFGERDDLNLAALKAILKCGARVQFGGGLRSLEAVERALALGVSRAILGTAAIENPDVVAQALTRFGAEKIAAGLDARDGLVRTRGWKADGGALALDLALRLREIGLRTVIFTDIRRDGLARGVNLAAARELAETSGLEVIASGGAHTLADVRAVKEAGLAGVIVGRALYEETIDLREALRVQDE
ncbi:MAG: 1-(5-phosphoribosyl)-5-[(5-phosphoribosylamino)methylideneamino]imidazole-4-carboxamide isomerase [Chloroflexi bacterium]|nr:1-(5-phosphoribosyl)-5-[(5-phosphoribosylamino)methylideneamino]imidazole-4-carboxamide isomerase [Chloroflexota bacterium]